jgi:hypothetical protein
MEGLLQALFCAGILLLIAGPFILADLMRKRTAQKHAADEAFRKSQEKMVAGKASDDATPPYDIAGGGM